MESLDAYYHRESQLVKISLLLTWRFVLQSALNYSASIHNFVHSGGQMGGRESNVSCSTCIRKKEEGRNQLEDQD